MISKKVILTEEELDAGELHAFIRYFRKCDDSLYFTRIAKTRGVDGETAAYKKLPLDTEFLHIDIQFERVS